MKKGAWSLLLLCIPHYTLYAGILNTVIDLGIQTGALEGAQIANEALTQDQAQITTFLEKSSTGLNNNVKKAEKKQQDAIAKQLNQVKQFTQTQQKNIANSYSQLQQQAQQEVDYIFKNISLQQPAQSFVDSQAALADIYFQQGAMLTPDFQAWYNPYPVGSWIYEPTSDSFLQTDLVPLWESQSKTKSMDKAANNSIFTEYFPSTIPYTIAGSVTIYDIEYPSFIGLMCNKARWISGNPEHVRNYRLLGIYAQDKDHIGIYFTQQQKQKNKKNPNIIEPLHQVVSSAKSIQMINPKQFANILHEPVTLHFEVTPQPSSIAAYFWFEGSQKPQNPISLHNLDTKTFLYHGLGFMSPGARTQWKLSSPQELLFSSQDRDIFMKKVSS